ncbi:outer membrane lipoprotein carrier protein LolA [bacterium]|nr:outer membrane lipoprotein carrier protein LolA [bacterium]
MKRVLLLLLTVILLGSSVWAGNDLDSILKKMDKRQRGMKDLKASFTQEKILELLEEKLISQGKMKYRKPDKMSWEYFEPDPLLMIIKGKRMWLYYPDMKVAEKYDLARAGETLGLFVGFGKSVEYLKKNYQIKLLKEKRDFYCLELIPKKEEELRYISKIILWVNTKEYWPVKTKIYEPNGDTTLIEFRNIEINTKIPDAEFEFKVPKGVEVVEPLKE